jgi:hypothetical protein
MTYQGRPMSRQFFSLKSRWGPAAAAREVLRQFAATGALLDLVAKFGRPTALMKIKNTVEPNNRGRSRQCKSRPHKTTTTLSRGSDVKPNLYQS